MILIIVHSAIAVGQGLLIFSRSRPPHHASRHVQANQASWWYCQTIEVSFNERFQALVQKLGFNEDGQTACECGDEHHTTPCLAATGLTSSMESQTCVTSKCHVTEKPLYSRLRPNSIAAQVNKRSQHNE